MAGKTNLYRKLIVVFTNYQYIDLHSYYTGDETMYTLDRQNLLSKNSTEIPIAEYVSPERQVWYALQGAVAILLFTLLAVTTSAVIWWKF
ncbi:hypothetical protein [Fischerella sp. JS2]|uniref:hypothetical protein n=1 Tax=Fischerella sp. JS2 TaxID=2597771 RepID=UPI0028EADAFA|nr:hypothetical protein [Fischerella sp. JS2]